MTQIGSMEVWTESNGWLDVAIFEPGTFEWEPIEVRCENQWGVLHVVDPGDADTPLEVYTESRGWQGISTEELRRIVEDWSSGDWQTHWVSDSTTPNKGVASYASRTGDYGYWSEGEARIWSVPGMGLPNYPEEGNRIEYWYQPKQWIDPTQYWFSFAYQGDYYPAPCYHVQWISDGTFRVQRRDSSSVTTLTSTSSGTVDWPTDLWLRGVVDWHPGGGFDTWVEYADGTQLTPQISSADSTYLGGGVNIRGSGNSWLYADIIGVVDWESSG